MSSSKKPNSSGPKRPGKPLSSRLLTMKFMQRATASALAKSNVSSSKRSSAKEAERDNAALQAALAEEERKTQESIRRIAQEGGESRWELSFAPRPADQDASQVCRLQVETLGYADLAKELQDDQRNKAKAKSKANGIAADIKTGPNLKYEEDDAGSASDSPPDSPAVTGRFTFGNFSRAKVEAADAAKKHGSEDEFSEGESEGEIKPKLPQETPDRGPLTSISMTNQRPKGGPCHGCGEMGHVVAECPSHNKRYRGKDYTNGRDSKRFKPDRGDGNRRAWKPRGVIGMGGGAGRKDGRTSSHNMP